MAFFQVALLCGYLTAHHHEDFGAGTLAQLPVQLSLLVIAPC